MTSWLLPAFLASLGWGVYYFILERASKRKNLATRGVVEPLQVFLLWCVFQLAAGVALPVLLDLPPVRLSLPLVGVGVLHALAMLPFLSAFAWAGSVEMGGLSQLAAPATLLWSFLLFGRSLGAVQVAAFCILLAGAWLVTERPFVRQLPGMAFLLMVAYAIACGAYFALANSFQGTLSPEAVLAASRWGILCFLLLILLSPRVRAAWVSLPALPRRPLAVVALSQSVVVIATLLTYQAIVRAPTVPVMSATLGSLVQGSIFLGEPVAERLFPAQGDRPPQHRLRRGIALAVICAGLWLAIL